MNAPRSWPTWWMEMSSKPSAANSCSQATWPTLSDQRVTTIEQQLEQRLGAVFKLIVDSFGKEETPAHMSWLETIWDDVKGLGRDVAKAGASKLLTVIAMEYARQAIDKYRQAWQV